MTIDALGALAKASKQSYGSTVSEQSSMSHDAVWSCRTRIAQDISMMPVDVILPVGTTRQPVPAPPIIAAPSAFSRPMDWRYQVIDSWLANGNVFGMVMEVTAQNKPLRIELLDPTTVKHKPGTVDEFTVPGYGDVQLWPLGRLWHIPAYTVSGQLLGLSPIAFHAHTISNGLAAQQYGKGFFDGGGHPSGILAPGKDPGKDGAIALKERFMQVVNGWSREPLVLPAGTTYTALQTNPSDSQFIATQQYSVEQICRIFGEDPADHGSSSGGSSITYANRTDAELARFKRRQFWVTKLQDALQELVGEPYQVKLNTSSTLMMTTKERHEIHKLRLDSKTITVNEIRSVEDEQPFDGDEYDEPGIPTETNDADEIERQAVILQKLYLTVGVILTADEARQMARDAGVDLAVDYDPALLGSAPQAPPPDVS